MLRKLLAVLAIALTVVLAFSASALAAPPYPAPPAYPAPAVVTVNGAPAAGAPVDTATALASTGFPAGATLLTAAIVLVLGVGLVVFGRRVRQSQNR